MPATAASAYRDGLSERSLRVSSRPSGRWATTSVKVPPRSTQNCQPFTSVSPMSRCSGPWAGDGALCRRSVRSYRRAGRRPVADR